MLNEQESDNGQADLALLIEYSQSGLDTERQVQVLALLANGNGHQMFALERPHVHFPNLYIRLIRRSSRRHDLSSDTDFVYERDVIGVEFEGEGGHAWIHRNGRFVSFGPATNLAQDEAPANRPPQPTGGASR